MATMPATVRRTASSGTLKMKKVSMLRWAFPVMGLLAAGAGAYVVTVPGESRLHVPISCSNLTAILLSETSVTPTTLAAMGASDAQVSSIVSAARALCEGEGGAFGQAHVAYEQAMQRHNTLEIKGSHGALDELGLAQLAAAREEVAAARGERAQLISQIETLVTSTLNDQQRAVWANIRAAKDVEVPIAQKVVARSESDWIVVRNQLAEERTQEARTDHAQPHQPVEIHPEVDVAQSAIDQNLASVQVAWRAAIGAR